ncbi:MAG: bifunctional UDP-N-acetylglucosamine diphosphorylase/glucosamine-1-phosphate N-acetyltransferase GlmU [Vicinamibacterales bacterium]
MTQVRDQNATGGPIHVVILAAGKGTRMRSSLPKVLHRVAELPLIEWVLRVARGLDPETITVILGHGADVVRSAIAGADVQTVLQEPQLGTGHALLQARGALDGRAGRVLVLSGDVPLLTGRSVSRLLAAQAASGSAVVLASAVVDDPTGYGRVVRDSGRMVAVVEDRDATEPQRAIREINSGIYVFALESLFEALAGLGTSNAQGEFYLPDLVDAFRRQGRGVDAVVLDDPDEIRGINTRSELAEVGRVLRARINGALMAGGVTLVDPGTAYIGPDVEVGQDCIIHPFVVLEGRTRIGERCEIHAGSRLTDTTLGAGVTVFNHTVAAASTIAAGASVGPFARIRPGTELLEDVHIGNFVEVKKSKVGAGTKIGHLSYIGDSSVGRGVNIGAGTITCNYDGRRKHGTIVGDGAFVGSDSTLVAPVRIGEGAYVAAGSSITEDVPDGALGIARGRQQNKIGWAHDRAKKAKDGN